MIKKYIYNFSSEKNQKLILERGISFEEIISAIESNCILDVIEHPNSQKYAKCVATTIITENRQL